VLLGVSQISRVRGRAMSFLSAGNAFKRPPARVSCSTNPARSEAEFRRLRVSLLAVVGGQLFNCRKRQPGAHDIRSAFGRFVSGSVSRARPSSPRLWPKIRMHKFIQLWVVQQALSDADVLRHPLFTDSTTALRRVHHKSVVELSTFLNEYPSVATMFIVDKHHPQRNW